MQLNAGQAMRLVRSWPRPYTPPVSMKSPRVALVFPRVKYQSGDPPLGLAYLAAVLRRDLPKVDVRILSATHQNLTELVRAGEFREDLFYRINVIELHVPALRDRGDDVLLLADHILNSLDATASLDDDARSALLGYAFPGNVRELENVLERAVTLCTTGTIGESDLSLRQAAATGESPDAFTATDLGNQVEDVQRQAIMEALEKTRFNKTAAAKLLGLSFRQLRYRIKKLGIE